MSLAEHRQAVSRKLALGLFTEMCLGEDRTCSKQDPVGLGHSSICKAHAVLGGRSRKSLRLQPSRISKCQVK